MLAGGPWANEWLASHGIPLKILRKHLYWFQVTDQTYDEPAFPCYFFETPRGYFYGTPHDPGVGLKLARHSGGQVVESMQGQQHQPDEYDQQLCQDFISDCLPAASTTLSQWAGCWIVRPMTCMCTCNVHVICICRQTCTSNVSVYVIHREVAVR